MKKDLKFFLILLFFPIMMFAQNRTIDVRGKITDERNEPLIGVAVQVKGTTTGTVTDVDGNFLLQDIDPDATLVISYVGMKAQTVNLNGRTSLDIVMQEDTEVLQEIVITGFGLSQKKETLTGAISSVSSKEIEKSLAATTSGAIVGKIAGINARQADGRPGNGFNIQIRNMGTPLYVIDGVQKDEGQFNNIDFNDIESISILKDASASIYGVRAANGVVVVTTKKGRLNQKNTITINANYGWQNLTAFAKPADASTYIRNYIQSETIQGVPDQNRKYTMEDLQKWTQGTEKGYRPFDWYDYIWNTAPQTYLGVNASGGSDKINYYLAIGNLTQDAMIVNYGGFNRTNIQLNVDAKINDKLKIGGSVNGRIEKRKNPGVPGADDYWAPIFATYRNLPMARPYANDNPKYPALTSSDPSTNFAMLNYDLSGTYQSVWRVGQFNFNAEYEIIPGLKAKALGGYYLAYNWLDNQEYTYDLYKYNEVTDTYDYAFRNLNPWRERDTRMVEELTSNIQLSYDKILGEHTINAVAGMETIKRDTPHFWVHSIPQSNALHLIDVNTIKDFDDYGADTEARIGYMGRFNYNYANKYLVELAARYDGSWKFPPNHRWGFFPSASVGWRISSENFWQNNDLLNKVSDLKIRASYGLVGDDNVGGYSAFDYMSGYNYKNGGAVLDNAYVIGSIPRGLAVTNISWIKAKTLDVGFDFGFLNQKITGTLDYFQRLRTGLPAARYDVLIPYEVGFGLPNENLNSDLMRGFDGGIVWRDRINADFNYTVGANFSYSRFYDWHQYKPRFGNSWDYYRNSISERYGYITWGYEAIGQFKTWDEIINYPVDIDGKGNTTLRPGDIIYKDVNNDKTINELDNRPIGYRQGSTPILNFGLNGSAQYKDFDFSVNFTGGSFNSWAQDWEQKRPFHDGGNNPQYYMEDTWHLSDIMDANSELIPGKYPTLLIGNAGHSNYWFSTFWLHNITYLKLRDLQVGYTLPSTLSNKLSITSCRIYFSGQNLFILKNTEMGLDPEIESTNGLQYPPSRIMSLGLTLKF
jgi:TonB-linked SusC/RagA family outer membrane protein